MKKKKGIKSYYGMGKKHKKKKGLYSYAEGKGAKKFSALEQSVSAPRKIKPEGKPEEELIYANKEEIKMLKEAGGSGTPTPYGAIRSFDKEIDEGQSGEDEDSPDQKNYSNTTTEDLSSFRDDPPDPGGDNDKPQPVNTSETRPYEGDGITLKGLYDAITSGDVETYLNKFKGRTETSTNSTGGTHTITYEDLDHGLTADMTQDDLFKDADGNIIGWMTDDGSPDFENHDEWYVDSEGNWFYVGTGAVGGAGGEGSTTIIGADGQPKTIGARSYADLLGFDADLLQDAIDDRANQVADLGRRQDYYGGKYLDAQGRAPGEEGFDSTTATFRGGKEQEMYAKADEYTGEFDRLMGEGEEKAKFWEEKAEGLLGDDAYYQGVEREVLGYRDRIREMADRGDQTPRGRQQSLYAQQAEQIERDTKNQEMQMRQMLAERGISPNSPLAIRMMNNIKSNEATSKRQARRSALSDAMQMQNLEDDRRLNLYGQAKDATLENMALRENRIGMYSGMGQTALDQRMRQAGMYAQQGSEMFSRGSYFGSTAQNLSQLRLAEAMDREANQEYKKLTGTQMDLSKYGMDKQAEIAQKIADMKASNQEGGTRYNLLGALAGGAAGYFMSGGNPYMASLGASTGSNIKI